MVCFFFIVVLIFGISLLFRRIFDKIAKRKSLPVIDSIGGTVVGLLRGVIIAAIVLVLLTILNDSRINSEVLDKSKMGQLFLCRPKMPID